MKRFVFLFALSLAGCTTPAAPELSREVVLRHLGGDFGTVGPFTKQRKKELDVLAPADKQAATALLEQGAFGFLIYAQGGARPQRVILVAKDKVVGDYAVP